MNDWIKTAIIRKFDERSMQSEKVKDIDMLKRQLLEMERGRIGNLSEGDQQLVHEWLDLYVRLSSFQNEWFYMKGIQDGVHLLMYLQLEGEY